jgi:thiol-disulfide isomerase/thioredoxin
MTRRALPLLALAALGLVGAPLNAADVLREGSGPLRATLDKMELQPFPADAWSKLSDWTSGDAITQAKIDGKPVLVFNWASWHPSGRRALQLAQRMADKYGGQGLIVVGVHHPQGWADAAKFASDAGAKFTIAHDAKGDFRQALHVDHDPEYYVLDRAGHLRYAAVSSNSLDEAIQTVANETPEQAGNLPKLLKEKAAEAAAQGRRTVEIASVNVASMPAVPPGYSTPPESAYKAVEWPKISDEAGRDFGLVDQQGGGGKRLEPKLNFSPANYYPSKPETQGRALVIYFWHPEMFSSYNGVMPVMDRLQQSNPRDVAVVGDVVPIGKLDPQRANNNPQEQDQAERLVKRYQQFVGSRRFYHTLAVDPQATGLAATSGQNGGNKAPGAIIVSSDGVVRWAGDPTSSDFRYAIDSVLANDPGVRARREADRKFIESGGK